MRRVEAAKVHEVAVNVLVIPEVAMRRLGGVALAIAGLNLQVPSRPLELTVHQPAAVVRVLDALHLVHEVWISNRLDAPATLTEVAVLAGGRRIAGYQGPALSAHVGRPGLPRTHPTPLVIEREQPAVVYFWIRLDAHEAPARLTHRVTFHSGPAGASTAPAIVDGGEAAVSQLAADVLGPPLRGRGWAAVYDPDMAGGHRTAVYTVDGKARIPGRFAIDWIRLLPSGRAHVDARARPDDWNGFGADVLAVSDARVAAAVDGHPDADASGTPREAVTRENAAGNYIALDRGNGRFAFYEHLQQGSLSVKAGARVTRGQVIGRVGSSGSVSSGPHLHFHVSDAVSTLGAEGMPFVFEQFTLRGAFASIGAFASGDAPLATSPAVDPMRRLERPGPNAVIDFPERR